jgi:ornithine decarboxylase
MNIPIKLIDIGGGFSSNTNLKLLNKVLEEFYDTFKKNDIKIISEPGRFFSASAIDLYCKVIAVKKRENCYHITINDSVYSTFNGKLFDDQKYIPIPLYQNNEMVDCVIFGQSCDSIDKINDSIKLPLPKLNDILMFQNMGAYSIAAAEGKFNGFCPPSELNLPPPTQSNKIIIFKKPLEYNFKMKIKTLN